MFPYFFLCFRLDFSQKAPRYVELFPSTTNYKKLFIVEAAAGEKYNLGAIWME